MNHKS